MWVHIYTHPLYSVCVCVCFHFYLCTQYVLPYVLPFAFNTKSSCKSFLSSVCVCV